MKALIYGRVSTQRQITDRQRIDIGNYCKINKIDIVDEYFEKMTGTTQNREVLDQLLERIKIGDIDYVIVSELTRLGRSVEVINTIKTIHDSKVGFISLKENIKTDVKDESGLHMANLLITFLSGIATFELSTFKYRSMSGLHTKVKNGGAVGSLNIPYGYRKDENKKLIIDNEESEVIRKIFELHLKGNGTSKIANYLNDNNILTRSQKNLILKNKELQENKDKINAEIQLNKNNPNYELTKQQLEILSKSEHTYNYIDKWVDGTVYSIIKNTIYIGKRNYKGEIFDQPQLRIIDDFTFESVQKSLKNNYNKGSVKNPNFNYIISKRKIICGICGQTYYPHKREKIDGKNFAKDNRYICLSKRNKKFECSNVGISIDKVENLVHQAIFYILREKLALVLDVTDINNSINDIDSELSILNKKIENSDSDEKRIATQYIKGKIKESILNSLIDEINKERKLINNQINILSNKKIELLKTKKNMEDIERIKKQYKNNNDKLPAEIIDKIVTKIVITKTDSYPELFNKVKGDKVVELKLFTGDNSFDFLISQRTDFITFRSEFGWLLMNEFFNENLPRKAFDFVSPNQ